MTYLQYRNQIQEELLAHPHGWTWKELKSRLALPYKTPCPEWTKRLESEIQLDRSEKKGNAKIWKLS